MAYTMWMCRGQRGILGRSAVWCGVKLREVFIEILSGAELGAEDLLLRASNLTIL